MALCAVPEDSTDVPAAQIREHDVQEHQVRRVDLSGLQRLRSAIGDDRPIAFLLEIVADHFRYICFIFNDQNFFLHRVPAAQVFYLRTGRVQGSAVLLEEYYDRVKCQLRRLWNGLATLFNDRVGGFSS